MIDAALLSHARNMLGQVAPELRQHPLYICDAAGFGGLPMFHRPCLGRAISGAWMVDYNVKAAIGNDWQGPGNVIVLCESEIRAAIRDETCFRDGVFNVALHEAAHLLPQREIASESLIDDCDFVRQWQRQKQAEADAEPEPPPDSKDNVHGLAFVRICCHLLGRAKLSGWDIVADQLFGGALWFIPQAAHWLLILLREIVEMREASFLEILGTEPPQEFSEMWEGCLAFHFKRAQCTRGIEHGMGR